MAIDPLTYAASDIAPVRPRTSFFDPADAVNIKDRYGMAASDNAFVSAREKERAAEARSDMDLQLGAMKLKHDGTLMDREDEEYKKKKEFETVRAQLLVGVAKMGDLDPDEYAQKMGPLLAGNPQVAEDPTFKAIHNLHTYNFEKRRVAEAQATTRMDSTTQALGELGINIKDVTNEKGEIDHFKMADHYQAYAKSKSNAEAYKQRREELGKLYGDNDSDTTRAALVGSAERLTDLVETRSKSVKSLLADPSINAALPDAEVEVLLKAAPNMTADAFEAEMLRKAIPKIAVGPDGKVDLVELMQSERISSPQRDQIKRIAAAARALWAPAHARGYAQTKAEKDKAKAVEDGTTAGDQFADETE